MTFVGHAYKVGTDLEKRTMANGRLKRKPSDAYGISPDNYIAKKLGGAARGAIKHNEKIGRLREEFRNSKYQYKWSFERYKRWKLKRERS